MPKLPEVAITPGAVESLRKHVLAEEKSLGIPLGKSALHNLRTGKRKATWVAGGVQWQLVLSTDSTKRDRVEDGFTEFLWTLRYDQGDRWIKVDTGRTVNVRGAVLDVMKQAVARSLVAEPYVSIPLDLDVEVASGNHYA